MAEHKRADLLRAIADGEQIQKWDNETKAYIDVSSCYCLAALAIKNYTSGFRVKPKTITIAGIKVPAPETVAPKWGTAYWVPDLGEDSLMYELNWSNDEFDGNVLKRGFLHLTQENAMAHAKALIKASGGEV